MKCSLFGTMSGPCFYHVKTTSGIYLLSDELELWKFQDWVNNVNMSMECLIFGTLLDQVRTKLVQFLAYHYSYKFSSTICQSVGSHILTQVLQWWICRPLVLLHNKSICFGVVHIKLKRYSILVIFEILELYNSEILMLLTLYCFLWC